MSDAPTPAPRPVSLVAVIGIFILLSAFGLLARRAYELSPAASTANLLRQAETALVEMLREEFSGDKVPVLRVDSEVLRRLPLSAPERYLLSRVDGQRTVEAIIQVSPIHELDALRCFRGFVDQGLVDLRAR